MGCSDSRPELSPPEERFFLGELELNYQLLESTKVDYIHRKYSHNGEINENQWLNINRRLNLSLNNPHSSFASTIKSYYEQYKNDQVYSLQLLLCLGIVLSSGTNEQKAKLIFEAFAFDGSRELDRTKVAEICNVFYKVFVKFGSALLKENPSVLVSSQEHDNFVNRMKEGKKRFKLKVIEGLIGEGESVKLEDFVSWFEDPKHVNLLTSSGYRKALRTSSKDTE